MAQLIVRNLDDELVRLLKSRAGAHGVSTEQEHRAILNSALFSDAGAKPHSFKDFLLQMPDAGDEDLFERDREDKDRGTEQGGFEN